MNTALVGWMGRGCRRGPSVVGLFFGCRLLATGARPATAYDGCSYTTIAMEGGHEQPVTRPKSNCVTARRVHCIAGGHRRSAFIADDRAAKSLFSIPAREFRTGKVRSSGKFGSGRADPGLRSASAEIPSHERLISLADASSPRLLSSIRASFTGASSTVALDPDSGVTASAEVSAARYTRVTCSPNFDGLLTSGAWQRAHSAAAISATRCGSWMTAPPLPVHIAQRRRATSSVEDCSESAMDGSLLCASWLVQVRPNQLPVVWAKLFARDSALGELLDGHAVTDGYRANAAGPARHIRDVCTQVLCQLGHASKSTGRKEFAQRHGETLA